MNLDHDGTMIVLDKDARRSLSALVRELSIDEHDLLLVGDGSGEDYRKPAGWCCVAYDRLLKRAIVHAGALTAGTTNFAELVPYWHALWYFDQEHKDNPLQNFKVAIVSDSEMTVRCGNQQYKRRANGCLWAGIEWFEKRAYVFRWHHVRRLSNTWNELADTVAGHARSLTTEMATEIEHYKRRCRSSSQ
jgi:ribonuclease HI